MKTTLIPRILRVASALALVAVLGLWAATGAHPGWTKTEITEMRRDEVTGIDYPVTQAGLVAGLDIVALGAGLAGGLFATSLVVDRMSRRAAA